jgi:long-chain acyl-CoA synthetase
VDNQADKGRDRGAWPLAGHYQHPVRWDMAFEPLSLPELLSRQAAAHPDAPLIDFFGRSWTYAGIESDARRFAAGLQGLGIAKGDRVGLFLPNVPIYPVAYFGALIAGATVVNFSPLYSAEELEAQVEDSGTRLLVTLDVASLLPTALEVLDGSSLQTLVVARLGEQLPWLKRLLLAVAGRKQIAAIPQRSDLLHWRDCLSDASPEPLACDPELDVALLQYTGGTTGTPKGAMLSHQNLTANARQVRAIDPDRDRRDVVLGVLPLFHVFANTCVLNRTIANGGCVVMLPRFEAGQALKTIARTRPTSMFAVPTMYQALLDHPDVAATDFSSLRESISGGAPLPLPLKKRFEEVTGVPIIEGYGLTEASGVVSSNPLTGASRTGTIGQPLPGTEIRLLDKEDATRAAPPGEPGELALRGPQVMGGYWNRPDADATAFAEGGWLRTGDIAVVEEDGFIRIVDRSKDMIAVGGFKVFPSRIENVLLEHPAVKEALVIGVPDQYLGEVPRAFITLKDGADVTGAGLVEWLTPHIGKHERVKEIVIRPSLPKTMIGKLDRKALRAEVLGG